jgi:hypothetical protein
MTLSHSLALPRGGLVACSLLVKLLQLQLYNGGQRKAMAMCSVVGQLDVFTWYRA